MRYANPGLSFSRFEVRDLVKAWVLTSLAFTFFFLRVGVLPVEGLNFLSFTLVFGISAGTAGIGFIVHELCHKIAAYRFGVHGEFRANTSMLFISLFFALMGFIIAAPGAVYMQAGISRKENGIISAAGPASNLVLVLLFAPLLLTDGILFVIGYLGVFINAILGAFNMIPFMNLDGEKILAWSKPVYFSMLLLAGLAVVAAYSL